MIERSGDQRGGDDSSSGVGWRSHPAHPTGKALLLLVGTLVVVVLLALGSTLRA